MPYERIYSERLLSADFDTGDDELPIKFEDDGVDSFVWVTAGAIKAAYDKLFGSPGQDSARASDISLNESLLRLAIVHDRTVEFRYAKGAAQVIETRRLQPSKLEHVKGHLTFTGFDPDRDDVRAYRLDRIKGEVSFV